MVKIGRNDADGPGACSYGQNVPRSTFDFNGPDCCGRHIAHNRIRFGRERLDLGKHGDSLGGHGSSGKLLSVGIHDEDGRMTVQIRVLQPAAQSVPAAVLVDGDRGIDGFAR